MIILSMDLTRTHGETEINIHSLLHVSPQSRQEPAEMRSRPLRFLTENN
jgi:hypothetical protein